MVGRALVRLFPEAQPLTHADLDVTDREAVRRAVGPGTSLVLNAAAFTRVDQAETDPAHLLVNAEAVGDLAERCREVGSCLVHVSTDYVFGGRGASPYREADPTDPPNAYGRGKLAGECLALARGGDVLIVRTSWLFGTGGASFPDAILRQAEAGSKELKVVHDQTGRPTGARDLARAIRLLVEGGARGIVHFANAGPTTWYEVARETLRLAGHPDVIIRPVSSSAFPRPARRPAWSVLDTSLYERTSGEKPRPWREALADFIAERTAGPAGGGAFP